MPMDAFRVSLSGVPTGIPRASKSVMAAIAEGSVTGQEMESIAAADILKSSAGAMARSTSILDIVESIDHIVNWKDATLSTIVLAVFLLWLVAIYIFYRYVSQAPPLIVPPPPESDLAAVIATLGTEKFNRNLRFTQNSLTEFCNFMDAVSSLHETYLTWRFPVKTRLALKYSVISTPVCLAAGLFVPVWLIKLTVAAGGSYALCKRTWIAMFLLEVVPKVVWRRTYEIMEAAVQGMPLPDSVVDLSQRFGWSKMAAASRTESNDDADCTLRQRIMVEVFENQRWWAGAGWTPNMLDSERSAWSDDSGLAKLAQKSPDSAPPLPNHIWIDEDWILDGDWAAVDEEGWVYT
ncbi:hypothetical protein HDU83_005383 [Entophlyctis luteolus]|nr:hypothetical protein HDU83_005383 [Entophlyctis luteolus]